MLEKEMITKIAIDASPRRVWQVLTDFPSYPKWNPMIRRIGGEVREGAVLEVHFQPEGRKKGRTFHPRLKTVVTEKELRWYVRFLSPLIFEFEHYWSLEPGPEESTLLEHGLLVRGLLAPLLMPVLERQSHEPFLAMNRAHKARAES